VLSCDCTRQLVNRTGRAPRLRVCRLHAQSTHRVTVMMRTTAAAGLTSRSHVDLSCDAIHVNSTATATVNNKQPLAMPRHSDQAMCLPSAAVLMHCIGVPRDCSQVSRGAGVRAVSHTCATRDCTAQEQADGRTTNIQRSQAPLPSGCCSGAVFVGATSGATFQPTQ
jgi:hypothetical protein